jgi:hypothetical protein
VSDDDPYASPFFAPRTIERIREYQAEIDAKVAAGTVSADAGAFAKAEFARLSIAHVREHGAEG